MKKLFVFDLDGTLLNSNHRISHFNIESIKKIKENNNLCAVATGRNKVYAKMDLKDHWYLFDYFVGCNGSLLENISKKRNFITLNKNISFFDLREFYTDAMEKEGAIQVSTYNKVFADFFGDKENSSNWITKEEIKKFYDKLPSLRHMDDNDKESIVQITIQFPSDKLYEFYSKWTQVYPDEYVFTINGGNVIDINRPKVNKLYGIKEIAKAENINDNDVYYFGDSQNDVLTLEHYQNTFAMSNAFDDAKRAAKNIIGDNNSETIGQTVKNILENK